MKSKDWCAFLGVALAVLMSAERLSGASAATPAERGKATVVIDARKTSEPISKYIYGQFIEHLGRCIYGGIWAEMLEDRKFFFPVTDKYDPYVGTDRLPKDALIPAVGASPWQIIGPPGSVTMVKEQPFVGEHSPLIAAGSGIRQRDLGLVKGKNYVGYVWLKAQKKAGPIELSLAWGNGQRDRQTLRIRRVRDSYRKHDFRFTAGANTDKGMLEIKIAGGPCFVGTVSLMPADNIKGMRADTLKLLKELNAPVYRWPGGNFVSGYDWRDGIGDRDRRPPRKNPAWVGIEHNDFGLDEFVAFCREVGTEPLIVVNTGFGDPHSAAEEVEYANGSPGTEMGRLRAKNGHFRPYNVKMWGIGNEMYGRWQLGAIQLAHYTQKHNLTVHAMRKVDPTIKVVGVGALGGRDPFNPKEERTWSFAMLEQCADTMNFISEHFYVGSNPDLLKHVRSIPDRVKERADGHRELRRKLPDAARKDIRISLDEWNYWHRDYVYGDLGCVYSLRDGLGIAAGLHEYFRNTDIITMANYAQTVNVIGCIKTSKTDASFDPPGLALKLYRNHFGVLPIGIRAPEPLDVAAALSADRKTLTVGIVNPTMKEVALSVDVRGVQLAGGGTRFEMAGNDPTASNEPGKEANVKIVEEAVTGTPGNLTVKPCSVTAYSLRLK